MTRVVVLKGGRSLERQVSLKSGARVEDALERLGEILGGVRAGDTRRGSEAAAHAALPGAAGLSGGPTVTAPPGFVGGETIDRSAPRPLR